MKGQEPSFDSPTYMYVCGSEAFLLPEHLARIDGVWGISGNQWECPGPPRVICLCVRVFVYDVVVVCVVYVLYAVPCSFALCVYAYVQWLYVVCLV